MTNNYLALAAKVKSRLLPLSPLARKLEILIECLPRRPIQIDLKPVGDVQIIDAIKGEYKAISHMANFEMVLDTSCLNQGGWYYLEAALVRNNGCRDACIRVLEEGGKEITLIPIATNLRGSVREVIFIPPNAAALIWSPTGAVGYFSQSELLFHKITKVESVIRRISRVIFDLWRFRTHSSILKQGIAWMRVLSNLQTAYQLTVKLRLNRQMGNDYAVFITLNDNQTNSDILAMKSQVPQFTLRPTFSIIMPLKASSNALLKESIKSLIHQIYPNWELLLVGGFSEGENNQQTEVEFQEIEPRIKLIKVDPQSDLANQLNVALDQSQGDYIFVMNQHDKIPAHALCMLTREINKHPDVELIYTDEDSIDDQNVRFDHRFKPDWNPDLFLSHHYVGKLALYSKAKALAIKGYRSGFEGAEEYDFALRYLKDIEPSKIKHIPRVLYHSRVIDPLLDAIDNSLHEETTAKKIAHQSAKRALKEYFNYSGVVVAAGPSHGLFHIKHPLPPQLPLVSIIIPTRDKVDILKSCIESIQNKTDYKNWEILVVDNNSIEPETHAYFVKVTSDERIKVLKYDHPFNYSAMNNFAEQQANGEILALLNNDVEVINLEWLTELVSHAVRPGIGAVGAKLLYANGLVQHAGVITGLGGVAGHAHKYLKADEHGYCHRAVVTQNLSAVTGACLVIKRSSYQEVGGLDEKNLVVALNDIDFCLKLGKQGYRNVFTPFAKLYHHESISRGKDDTPEKHALFLKEFEYMKNTWGAMLQNDPAYNPNLTLEFENFSLKAGRV